MASKTSIKFTSTSHAESSFVDLFCDIIPKIHDINKKKQFKNFTDALKDIRKLRLKRESLKKPDSFFYTEVQYLLPVTRLAYLYAYGVLHTCVVHKHFLNYLKECADLQRLISHKKSLNICCLGGGAGVEAIAIIKIINDFIESSNCSEENKFTVHVTVVDICKEWKPEMLAIMNAVNNCPDILNAGRIKISANFIQADLLKDIEPDLEKEIVEADIITVVKVSSDINQVVPENLKKLCKNMSRIGELLKPNSCLFILENAGGGAFSKMKTAVNIASKSTKIKSVLHQFYSLKTKSILKIHEMFASPNPNRYDVDTTILTTVSSCILVKTEKQCEDIEEQKSKKFEKQSKDKEEQKRKKIEKQSKDKEEQKSKKIEKLSEDKNKKRTIILESMLKLT